MKEYDSHDEVLASVEFHPYPQEMPERNGKYLVLVIVFEENPHGPRIMEDYWTGLWRYNRKPLAWAELPKSPD